MSLGQFVTCEHRDCFYDKFLGQFTSCEHRNFEKYVFQKYFSDNLLPVSTATFSSLFLRSVPSEKSLAVSTEILVFLSFAVLTGNELSERAA